MNKSGHLFRHIQLTWLNQSNSIIYIERERERERDIHTHTYIHTNKTVPLKSKLQNTENWSAAARLLTACLIAQFTVTHVTCMRRQSNSSTEELSDFQKWFTFSRFENCLSLILLNFKLESGNVVIPIFLNRLCGCARFTATSAPPKR